MKFYKKDSISPETINILEEIGGPQGIADSSIPGLIFITVFSLSQYNLKLAAAAAVLAGIILAIIRLLKSEELRFVIAGFVGVAIAAFIATKTGRAEDFFLPGLILNGGYALIYLFSILTRWPLIGLILETGTGQGTSWRKDSSKVKAYSKASFVWVMMFLSRLVVQLPLYFSGAVVALGIVKTFMGIPFFILALWLSWLILRENGINFNDFIGSFSKKKKD